MVNPTKSQCVIFRPSSCKSIFPQVYLNDESIPYVREAKYLGVLLNEKLHDGTEILKQRKSLYARCNTILRKFLKCSQNVKKQLFTSFCTNIYCLPLWCNYREADYAKLKVAYNNVFRSLFRLDRRASASMMFAENNVLNFESLVRRNVFSFMERIKTSQNTLIATVCASIATSHGPLFEHWDRLLYTIY